MYQKCLWAASAAPGWPLCSLHSWPIVVAKGRLCRREEKDQSFLQSVCWVAAEADPDHTENMNISMKYEYWIEFAIHPYISSQSYVCIKLSGTYLRRHQLGDHAAIMFVQLPEEGGEGAWCRGCQATAGRGLAELGGRGAQGRDSGHGRGSLSYLASCKLSHFLD